ncbi:AraC family transcriptional regulator [Mucilaginibacter agri]|uniref:Helix-turn-helix domain-containing protein n=1 Tax=Mucilaginibacter agri TaxID=2695265 RepID=A0A965ZLG4_9SPHI|nr:helix-turn-helix domain-containing protein [Mucilaginibacter agri]NCD72119.1 helix-turn-helix domain-containing protein [Mucilaginibacter agri]
MKHLHNFQATAAKNISDSTSFNICTIQSVLCHRQHENMNDHNNHFAIIWVTKGDGNYWADMRPCEFQNNCLLFIKPGQFESIQLRNASEGYIFSFSKLFLGIEDHDSESLLRSLHQMFATQSVLLQEENIAEMQDLTNRMIKEYSDFNLYRTEMLRRYFKIFLIHLSRQFENLLPVTPQSRNIDLLQNFVSLLEQNFRNQKMVADYANHLAVTPNYLNEVVKKITGYPAGHHIRQRVALEAKRKAAYSDTGMKEIAYDLGFFDLAHFSKFFKNTTGMSFSDFKKNRMGISSASLMVN